MAARANPILKTYNKEFVECRGFGHTWIHYDGLVDHHEYGTVKGKMSECSECGGIRYRWYLWNGKRFGQNTYEMPEGYSVSLKNNPGVEALPSMEEWRALGLKAAGFRASPNVSTIKARRKTA